MQRKENTSCNFSMCTSGDILSLFALRGTGTGTVTAPPSLLLGLSMTLLQQNHPRDFMVRNSLYIKGQKKS